MNFMEKRVVNSLLLCAVSIFITLWSGSKSFADDLTVTTWNIEHFGSPGRGFGGGKLPKRGPTDFKKIASFIKNDLKSDVLALKEIAITNRRLGASYSKPLKVVVSELKILGDKKWQYYLPPVKNTAKDEPHNEFLGFLWNAERARLLRVFELDLKIRNWPGKDCSTGNRLSVISKRSIPMEKVKTISCWSTCILVRGRRMTKAI